jgi:hypothetical protein
LVILKVASPAEAESVPIPKTSKTLKSRALDGVSKCRPLRYRPVVHTMQLPTSKPTVTSANSLLSPKTTLRRNAGLHIMPIMIVAAEWNAHR